MLESECPLELELEVEVELEVVVEVELGVELLLVFIRVTSGANAGLAANPNTATTPRINAIFFILRFSLFCNYPILLNSQFIG